MNRQRQLVFKVVSHVANICCTHVVTRQPRNTAGIPGSHFSTCYIMTTVQPFHPHHPRIYFCGLVHNFYFLSCYSINQFLPQLTTLHGPCCDTTIHKAYLHIVTGHAWCLELQLCMILIYYFKLHVESKAPTLAVKLARECYFGESVMKLCTPMGFRDEPGLPLNELWELKKTVFNIFPKFWACPVEFEPLWTSCIDALGHACRRLKV